MVLLAGIDEAGFGPLLGPLVVSSCAFSVRPEMAEGDLWQVLRKSVGRTRKGLRGRLLVADSKKAYKRSEGLGHLERSALGALGCLGKNPSDLGGLLAALCPDCLGRLIEYPWYRETERRLLPVDRPDLRIAANVFADDMAHRGVKLVDLASHCLDVAHYNTMIHSVKNKAQVLFMTTTRLMQSLLDQFPGQDIHILIDRQGGRVHYREHLLRSFSEMDLRIVGESEQRSAYELRSRSRVVQVSFEVGADDCHFAVALASMVSKYVRELLMERVNRYFAKKSPELRPTAGYWKDGLRFLEDVRSQLPEFEIDRHRLVRCR
jgi:ribonuclease HII